MHGMMIGLGLALTLLQNQNGVFPPPPAGSFLVTEEDDPFITEDTGDNFIIE